MRTAVIAGGSGGIGRAVSTRLAADGLALWVTYHQGRQRAVELVEAVRASGGTADHIKLDLRNPDQAAAVCREIYSEAGSLDVLVNAAAINVEAPALGLDEESWRTVLEVNLDGAFRLSRAAAQYMMLGRWGRIIHLSSIAAARGGRGQVNYAASKAGVEALVRVLGLELGRKGVLVNCVAPGVIETDLSARIRKEHAEETLAQIAMRRFGRAEEVAAAVGFLASEAASYINGQVLRVDGGFSL